MEQATASTGIVWDDDFQDGFSVGQPEGRWFYYGFGPYVGDDGVVMTDAAGLHVRASGSHPVTGKPAFVRTLAQEQDNGAGLPGTLEHVKWLAFANHEASTGLPGFDATPGHELSCEAWMSGATYGTDGHPFGGHVDDPQDDLRLASVGMPLLDAETSLIVDFFLSNRRVYVVYERLPFTRHEQGNYAAFVYQVPVADRAPGDSHHCRIGYDRSAGVVTWLLDGEEVFRVDRLGHRLASREHLVVDHGGDETTIEPRQLSCGLGMFTSLDYAKPGNTALVKVSSTEGYYYSTATGPPEPQPFHDDKSLESNRLFGQGASLDVGRFVVASRPV
jgi:hypothetical protein